MNIIDAVKSGKRFRRRLWFENLGDDSWVTETHHLNFMKEDILADDWEVEEPDVKVTRTRFYEAWRKSVLESEDSTFCLADILAKELGLGEL